MKYAAIALMCFCFLPVAAGASFFDDDTSNPCVLGPGATFEPVFSDKATAVSPSIVRAIESAKTSIRIASHDFLSKPVAEAVVKAARGRVDVKMVLNKKQTKSVYSAASFFRTMSIEPHITKADDVLFSDYIVIDERDVIVGNFAGFTDEDDEKKNAASALIIHNAPDAAKRYLANWQGLWAASEVMPEDKNQ